MSAVASGTKTYLARRRRKRNAVSLAVHRRIVDLICRGDMTWTVPWTGTIARALAPVFARATRRNLAALLAGVDGGQDVDIRRAARELLARKYMDRLLTAYTRRRGWSAVTPMIDRASLPALDIFRPTRRATILVTWHIGPPFGLSTIFAHLNIPSLGVMRRDYNWPLTNSERVFTTGSPDARAAVLWAALDRLKDGGLVIIAIDGLDGVRADPVPCFGRAVQFARGPFMLARLSGATVIPVVPRWGKSGRIGVFVGEPLVTDRPAGISDADFETGLIAQAGKWFERYVTSSPEEMRTAMLRVLLDHCPRLSS